MKNKILLILLCIFLVGCSTSNTNAVSCVVDQIIQDDSGKYYIIRVSGKENANDDYSSIMGQYVIDVNESLEVYDEISPVLDDLQVVEVCIDKISYKFYKIENFTLLK